MKNTFKNVAALQRILDTCDKHGASYKPSNTSIDSSALKTLFAEAQNAIQAEQTLQAQLETATRLRAKAFKELPLFVTRFVSAAKAAGMSKDQLEYIDRIARRFRSQPFKSVDTVATESQAGPTTNAGTATRFNRQLGYVVKAGRFSEIINRMEGEPAFNPKEPEFTVEGLKSKLAELQNYNANVIKAKNALNQGKKKRNEVIFSDQIGIPAVVRMVKAYIHSLFGTHSVEFREISSIKVKAY